MKKNSGHLIGRDDEPISFEFKSLISLCMPGYDPTCDNDRLEFLGDAVLDYVVAFEYYNNISAYTPASVHWAKLGFQIVGFHILL